MVQRAVKHPHYLVESFWGDPSPQNLFHILSNLPRGISEVVFHLGINDGDYLIPNGIDGNYYLMRAFELFTISSVEIEEWLKLLNIQKIGYKDL